MSDQTFFQNKNCAYFPCHKVDSAEDFNCLFCYCPLYALGKDCGGNYTYTKDGVKDCSACVLPHKGGGYQRICAHLPQLIDLAKD